VRFRFCIAVGLALVLASTSLRAAVVPADLSGVRGFNYTTSLDTSIGPRGHAALWLKYDAAQVEQDLTNARRLNLNSVRVFVAYSAWAADPALADKNLVAFVRTCHQHGIGVMLGLIDQPRPAAPSAELPPELRPWLEHLVHLVGNEPGLAFWDAANEPDGSARTDSPERTRHLAIAKETADLIHQIDHRTPVTIGCVRISCMKDTAANVDVLSWHDYSGTRAEIRAAIVEAQSFAASVHKLVFNSEIGCIARANPYDVTLEEFQRAHMGFYLWELTITHEWGDVHGVFYPDGSVRDPSIAAAVMGFFRNRGTNTVLENPDREHRVTRAVAEGNAWLAQTAPDWQQGLNRAEEEANLLEAAQLVPMREPPTRTVELLRAGSPNIPALQALVRRFVDVLTPYRNPVPPPAPTTAGPAQ
jgi:hypothetical protein